MTDFEFLTRDFERLLLFRLVLSLKEAKNVILDQSAFHVDNQTFNQILELFDTDATQEQLDGMKRLLSIQAPWSGE